MSCGCGCGSSGGGSVSQVPGDGSGSYGPDGSLSSYYGSLRSKICTKCATFWVILALIVLVIYRKKG